MSLSTDKKALASQLEQKLDYVRRIEAKLTGGAGAGGGTGNYLAEKTAQLRARLKASRAEAKDLGASAATNGRLVAELEQDCACLRDALVIRAEELGAGPVGPGTEFRENLLFQLAKSREERHRLALELAQSTEMVQALRGELESTSRAVASESAQVEGLRARLLDTDSVGQAMEGRIDELTLSLETREKEREAMLRYAEGQADRIATLNEQSTAQTVANDSTVDALNRELAAFRRSESEARASLHMAEERLGQARQVQELTARRFADQKGFIDELQREMQTARGDVTTKQNAVVSQQGINESLTLECAALRDRVEQVDTSRRMAVESRDEMSAQNAELHIRIDRGSKEREEVETQLKRELETTLVELQSAMEGKRATMVELDRALTERDTEVAQRDQLEQGQSGLHADIQQLKEGKIMLQRSLLEQINGLKRRITVEEVRADLMEWLCFTITWWW